MGKEKERCDTVSCPLGRVFVDIEKSFGKNSSFYEHFGRSQVEFLKAIRSLVDKKIQDLEKKGGGKKREKVTKIDIE
ncbi:MAG: hypothetical protein JW882_22195 [Deltaproteobacteria bacterium]|nr:hypothetical protein [Deltaproteobacteria bacterium]